MAADGPSRQREEPALSTARLVEVPTGGGSDPQRIVHPGVLHIEKEFASQHRRRWIRRLILLGAVGGAIAYFRMAKTSPSAVRGPTYETYQLTARDIRSDVEATGELNPLREVQVSSQVSGRVVEVNVDFNDSVVKGQLLARIDPSVAQADLEEIDAALEADQASLDRAVANLAAQDIRLQRTKALVERQLSTPAQLQDSKAQVRILRTEVNSAAANIRRTRARRQSRVANLGYTDIVAPIDGVVTRRSIDTGQTVASSYSAPDMFLIAHDLRAMQVYADIDEADVGKVREGMTAQVVVDAYPGKIFKGKLRQLRYAPEREDGVVTYPALIDVANPDLELRPGMTATVTLQVASVHQVAAVPNAALRFRNGDTQADSPPEGKLAFNHGRVYRLPDANATQLEPLTIELGLSDGIWTEVASGPLKLGEWLVLRKHPAQPSQGGLFGSL